MLFLRHPLCPIDHSTDICVSGHGLARGSSACGYYVFVVMMFLGTSNAVNFTDGLDGLLSGTSALAFGAYAVIAVQATQPQSAIFSAAMVGAVLGFLVFNKHPAKMFMGDTGSLGIGGGHRSRCDVDEDGVAAVVIGGVFVIEMLIRHHPGRFFQDQGQTGFQNESDPSPFRAFRLVGMAYRHDFLAGRDLFSLAAGLILYKYVKGPLSI